MSDLFDNAQALETSSPASFKASETHKKRAGVLSGIGRAEIIAGAAFIAVMGWGAWVTKSVISAPPEQEIVQLQLQSIIAEYIQAQARSGSDQNTAARETALFMQTVDEKVAELSAEGKVVLVREAVLGGAIPDVTDVIKEQVYAEVALPQARPVGGVRGEMESFLASGEKPRAAVR